MHSFVQEFEKYKRQERFLTGAIILLSVCAPLTFSFLLDKSFPAFLAVLSGISFMGIALWIFILREKITRKLLHKYENLDVGYVLRKKIGHRIPRKFVITSRDSNYFYLKCLETQEVILLSKDRLREDFDIAN